MYYNNYNNPQYINNDRQFFLPFLLGGLAGAGIVGISRPRPVFVNSPVAYPPIYRPYPTYPPYNSPSGYYNYQSGGFY